MTYSHVTVFNLHVSCCSVWQHVENNRLWQSTKPSSLSRVEDSLWAAKIMDHVIFGSHSPNLE